MRDRIQNLLTFLRGHPAGAAAVVAVVLGFGALVAQHHHPVQGLTRFFQLNIDFAPVALPEMHREPVYIWRHTGGYDGQFYSQLALRPTLRDPALVEALDNFPFRARRILGSWIAWVLGAGDAGRVLDAYAWLNVGCWVVLAVALLRLFPPVSLHNVIAWGGLLFSVGALTSVRYALTDLPALTCLVVGLLAWRPDRPATGLGLFAAAALARETSLLAGATLFQEPRWSRRILSGLVVVIPLAAWLLYVRLVAGPETAGLRNFDWPLRSLVLKWQELLAHFASGSRDRVFWGALGSLVGLTVQGLWFVLRPAWRDRWWQLGASYTVLLVCLGWPTFEGFPAAATRILLPLQLAFNAAVPASRTGLFILILGNASWGSGLLMMSDWGRDPFELAHRAQRGGGYIASIEQPGWYGVEQNRLHIWSWSSREGHLDLRAYGRSASAPVHVRFLAVPGSDEGCPVTVSHGEHIVWQGRIQSGGTLVELRDLTPNADGRVRLKLFSEGPTKLESGDASGRHLTFAVYDLVFLD